ncbi:MAG TPA: adenylyl-sulfate kinase [Nitrospirota bacterium]|nr:adenylyl-sulfate kinase [Nitrospirota bacterium]
MNKDCFGLWITGIPASGKSCLSGALQKTLHERGIVTVVLESDALRRIFTKTPSYEEQERDRFYEELALLGHLLIQQGVNVIFDATAHKSKYRDRARELIPLFIEVYLTCPLAISMQRDPKGIYQLARSGGSHSVPGFQIPYEPPRHPEVLLDCRHSPQQNAATVLSFLISQMYI